ncbi:unnamed protein product [Taenia asiatica]|uniref:LIM zinc-binding domain-containing protein n=1 Tax=Taenia asiatica TaxID=60517 RepID=A0A158R8R7_TAEAS|nr:unnamed protein product [Taenia asiatica]
MVSACSVLQKYLPEKLGEPERNDKRPLPMRVRLMCHSDCVKADNMGMSVAALGDSDGPPFIIQDIVKGQCPCSISVTASVCAAFFICQHGKFEFLIATNDTVPVGSFASESCDLFDITLADSMADRGHLEVGDELFSVDNLCCSFVADRPILVPTLAKLHQVLERLAKKQRPVEVKVFRSHGPFNRAKFFPYFRHDKSGALKGDASGDRGITLVEVEKVHPVRGFQHFLPSAERVEAAYSDPEMVYTIPPQMKMASTVATIEAGIELSQSKSPSEFIGVSDTVKAHQCGHSDSASCKNYAQLLPPVSAAYPNPSELRSFSSILEAPTLPPTPPPPLSNWPLPTLSEAPPSICSIPTPPSSTPELTSSRPDRHPSIALLLTPPPPACGNFAAQPVVEQSIISKQELHPQFIPNQRCRSPSEGFVSAQQFRDAQGVVSSATIDILLTSHPRSANEDMDNRNASLDSTPLLAKVLNSQDPTRTDANQILRSQKHRQDLKSQDDTQYDSDVSSWDEGVHFESNPSGLNLKSELKIAECKVHEDSLLVASDVDNNGSPQKKREKVPKPTDAATALLLRECVVQYKEPIEEVDSYRLPSIVSKEQKCKHYKEHELPEVATSGTKTETLMAEIVTMDTLQSLEGHADFATSFSPKAFGKFGQVTEARMKEDNQRENAHPPQTNTRLLSSRILGGPWRNRIGLSPVRAPRVNVIGTWYTCAGCNQQLAKIHDIVNCITGTSDLMIIEQLSLFYHLSCFVCARCGIQLSDGQNETSVRIRNGLIYCYICYHRISKSLSRSKEINEGAKLRESPTRSDRHSSLARSSTKIGQFFNTSPSCQSSEYFT